MQVIDQEYIVNQSGKINGSKQSDWQQNQQSKSQQIMAFVFQTKRKVNQVSKLVSPVGPGQYFQAISNQKQQACAPFNSTKQRKTFFDEKPTNKTGPGQYQISKNIVEPNIKTVSNSHSIIVKINSTGTSEFKSARNRFGHDQTDVPGPGSYQYGGLRVSKKRSNSSFSQSSPLAKSKAKRQLSQSLKHYPAIPQRIRGLTDMKGQQVVPQPQNRGPAHYNPQKKYSLNSTSAVWGKDKVRRFSKDTPTEVGPGKYKLDLSQIKGQDKGDHSSSNFKSATVRTYFDSLYYKTNLNKTARQRDLAHFKPKQTAPGQYQVNQSSFKLKQKPFSFQFFGSTVERFAEPQINMSQKPKSSTFYNIRQDPGKIRSFNKGKHGFDSETGRKTQFLMVRQKDQVPGPGHYKQKIVVQKKLRGINVERFGSTTVRPFHSNQKKDNIGPGMYFYGENQQDQLIRNKFGQVRDVTSNFKSTTKRNCFGEVPSELPLGQYDVSQNDISKKIEKQKNFLENLKKIQVQKAPFETTHSRFPHYENKDLSKQKKQNVENINKQHQLRIKEQSQKARTAIIEFNKTQVKQKQINGQFPKENRFKQFRKGAPGVGQYKLSGQLQKKTFNVKYAGIKPK